jgi:hypothetical protein
MRFISLYKPASFREPTQQEVATMGKLIDELTRSGVLIATGGFQPCPKDVKVALKDGKTTVTDGPFTESKELIGGYALFELPSRDAVIELAQRFLRLAGGGECEIHELCT